MYAYKSLPYDYFTKTFSLQPQQELLAPCFGGGDGGDRFGERKVIGLLCPSSQITEQKEDKRIGFTYHKVLFF